MQFNNTPLVIEQNNYASNNCKCLRRLRFRYLTKKTAQKIYIKKLFGATNVAKDKEMYLYSSYGIALDGKGKCSFGNDFVRNVIMFGVDNSSSSYSDLKNDFLIFGE